MTNETGHADATEQAYAQRKTEVSYEQIGEFAAALLPHVPDAEARSAILQAAREAFGLRFPECGVQYRPDELAFPPTCRLPLGHGGEIHDDDPDATYSAQWHR